MTKQIKHTGFGIFKYDIPQLKCGLCPRADISTLGHHISILHLQVCITMYLLTEAGSLIQAESQIQPVYDDQHVLILAHFLVPVIRRVAAFCNVYHNYQKTKDGDQNRMFK